MKLSHLKQIIKEEFLKEYERETNKPSDREFEQAINDVEVIIPLISHRILHDKNMEHNEKNIAKLNKIILQKVREGNDEILDEMWELAGSAIMKNAINIITFYTKANLQESIQRIREIKVTTIGNLTIDPQIQKYIDNNPDSYHASKYKEALPSLKEIYETIRNLGSTRPISFELGIVRNYPWLAKMHAWYHGEDELALVAKKGLEEFAIQYEDGGGEPAIYASANTPKGKEIIWENSANEPGLDFKPVLDAFIEWGKFA